MLIFSIQNTNNEWFLKEGEVVLEFIVNELNIVFFNVLLETYFTTSPQSAIVTRLFAIQFFNTS